MIIVLIIIVTSLWVLFDAKKLMKNIPMEERKKITGLANKPWQWFLGSLLLWIVCFPLYLIKRPKYKASI